MSIIDTAVNWYITKYRTPRVAPKYVQGEVGLSDYGVPDNWFADWSGEQQREAAAKLSWIFSNIVKIGNGVASADFNVYEAGSHEKDIDHPFERLMKNPNPFFDGPTLLKYLIWALSLDDQGAYWFLAPARGSNELAEIWPIMIGRMTPIKDGNQFIKGYLYTANNGEEFFFRKEFVCRFIYPDPFDMYKSWPPLNSAGLPISVYQGVTTAQRDMFTESRGAPLSVLSLDANISDPDFSRARQRIRDDWAEQRKIAVVRAGSLDVETVGLSNRDLEIIAASEFTRDEIDAVFMNGIMWRRDAASGERGEINKEIVDNVYHPLHRMLAAQIQISIITPFYGEQYIGQFEDIRAQDRSIQLQENQFYFRVMTMDEARAARGLAAWKWAGHEPEDLEEGENPPFEDFGALPFALATNPSFISSYYALSANGVKDPGEKPPESGNLPEQLDPERVVDELAGDTEGAEGTDLKSAAIEGMAAELRRYKAVARKAFRSNPDKLQTLTFETSIVPSVVMNTIAEDLKAATTDEEVMQVFSTWLH